MADEPVVHRRVCDSKVFIIHQRIPHPTKGMHVSNTLYYAEDILMEEKRGVQNFSPCAYIGILYIYLLRHQCLNRERWSLWYHEKRVEFAARSDILRGLMQQAADVGMWP